MKVRILFFILVSVFAASISICFASGAEGKKIIVIGEGVTGLWSAEKISKNLSDKDKLIIISPPQNEIRKNIGNGVIINYTTSDFIPIGIQIEMGPFTLNPPTQQDVNNAKALSEFSVHDKLYVSSDLDSKTERKLNFYVNSINDAKINKAQILLKYHRDICLKGWKNYLEKEQLGADFLGTVIFSENHQALERVRSMIINNRVNAGYPAEESLLNVVDYNEIEKILPGYQDIIKEHKLYGLVSLSYDGRVKGSEVKTILRKNILSSKPKITELKSWVSALKFNKDDKGNITITGVLLKNGQIINADVVVCAAGQGAESILKTAGINLPILKKWGASYSLPKIKENPLNTPTVIKRGLGIIRDVPGASVSFGVGEWILPEGSIPDSLEVLNFIKESASIFSKDKLSKTWLKEHPIYVQPRPMTLDGLPVLDSNTKGLIILNPSGSQGNTQAPGSAHFAASKTLEQLGRNIPKNLILDNEVDWKQFELYVNRF